MYMPMMPDAIEHSAPTKKAIAVLKPRAGPKISVSATSLVSKAEMSPKTPIAPTTARTKIVEYWRLMKATAPSKIVPATACISGVPVSRASTSRAR